MLGLIAPQYGQDTPELSRQKRVKLKPYKCPTCGYFHLTKAENLKR